MPQPWKVLSSHYVLERWWLKVRQDHVQLPSGHEIAEFHVLEYPDWTMVLALDSEGRMPLVEQYRHGIGRSSLEFPSGMVEPGEDPLFGARREFEEETGFIAQHVVPLGVMIEDPSRHNNQAFAFFSDHIVTGGSAVADETEHLKLVLLTPREVHQAILNGRMVHGLHIGTFYRAVALGTLRVDLSKE